MMNDMKIEITDKEIRVTWLGETRVCNNEDIMTVVRNAPDDVTRKKIILTFWDTFTFTGDSEESTTEAVIGVLRNVGRSSERGFDECLDDYLSHLGELFNRAHTEGLDKMFDEPKHLSDGFIKKINRVNHF